MFKDHLVERQQMVWFAILVFAAVLCSWALACGMPFAAIGALAALTLPFRKALVLALLAWTANQLIGFGFLGYPLDPLTVSWGVALGLSSAAAVVGAKIAISYPKKAGPTYKLALAFLTAWAGQQAIVFLASLVLGGTATAFAAGVVWFIFWTNAVAFLFLALLQLIAGQLSIAGPLVPRDVAHSARA